MPVIRKLAMRCIGGVPQRIPTRQGSSVSDMALLALIGKEQYFKRCACMGDPLSCVVHMPCLGTSIHKFSKKHYEMERRV